MLTRLFAMPGKPEKLFAAEYAKGNKSSCKICVSKIDKDELRIGHYMKSEKFDGWIPSLHHVKCFFTQKRDAIETSSEIAGFSELKFSDQQAISIV